MLKKTLKDSAIVTVIIFAFKIIIRLVFNPSSLLEMFEYGVWTGLGMYLTSLVLLFIVTFLILFVVRTRRKTRTQG